MSKTEDVHVRIPILKSAADQAVPLIATDLGDEEVTDENKPFTHIPNKHRTDGASQSKWRHCWVPMKILLLLLFTPILFVLKLFKAVYEVFRFVYLALVNQDRLSEKVTRWFLRNRTKKTRRNPPSNSLEKESAGIDLLLQNVEKQTFTRVQPTPEYLAVENLILKVAAQCSSPEQVFIRTNRVNVHENVHLRWKEIQRNKNILCTAHYKLETNCSISRSDFRIESYWMIWPGVPDNAPIIFYIHGGAFIVGNTLIPSYVSYLGKLSCLSKCRVFSINYRLCPQFEIIDAIDDCEDALNWLTQKEGIEPSRLVLAGESAGGGLCLMLMQRLNAKGALLPKCAHLISPFTQFASDEEINAKCAKYAGVCLLVHVPLLAVVSKICTGVIGPDMKYNSGVKVDLSNPDLNPSKGDFKGLPPLQFLFSNWEVLHDYIVECANNAEEAGVEVDLVIKEGLLHAWPLIAMDCLETDMAVTLAAEFFRKHLFTESSEV